MSFYMFLLPSLTFCYCCHSCVCCTLHRFAAGICYAAMNNESKNAQTNCKKKMHKKWNFINYNSINTGHNGDSKFVAYSWCSTQSEGELACLLFFGNFILFEGERILK